MDEMDMNARIDRMLDELVKHGKLKGISTKVHIEGDKSWETYNAYITVNGITHMNPTVDTITKAIASRILLEEKYGS
jgi:hypothetical protein